MSRRIDSGFPFPLSDVSNGEWCPRPPNALQRAAAKMLGEEAERRAKRLGMSRRQFLRTAAGTATAYMVLNTVHGLDQTGPAAALPVRREQCDDPEAARELFEKEYFVMDVQLHHVDTERFNVPALGNLLRFRDRAPTAAENLALLSQMNMIKEVFIDSETAVGVISGIPNGAPLPVDTMAATRDLVNEFAGSQRALSQAMCDPQNGPESSTSIASLEHQVRDLGASALKCYTGAGAWWLDDEEIAYPMLEEASRLGLRVINVHKGFPTILPDPMADTYVQSRDLPKVSRDWPRLKFVAYHAGYFGPGPVGGLTGIDEFLSVIRTIPHRRNVYAEIGSSFAVAFTAGPRAAAHLVGSLLRDLGPNRIVWGTDSIWWGSPQWQIDGFKNLQIPEDMQRDFGYPPLTERAKRHILGLNAARLYRVRPREKRCTIAEDRIGSLRRDLEWVESNRSLERYGPRTRREFLAMLRGEGKSVG
jgi:hypothetical protein